MIENNVISSMLFLFGSNRTNANKMLAVVAIVSTIARTKLTLVAVDFLIFLRFWLLSVCQPTGGVYPNLLNQWRGLCW